MARQHLNDIASGLIDQGNIIGIRKLFNANARDEMGYSTSVTAPRLKPGYLTAIERALAQHEPRASSALTVSGLAILRNKRWRHRFTETEHAIIADLDVFRLVRFDWIDRMHCVPVWRAVATDGRSFCFRNIPWQAVVYGSDPAVETE